MSANPFGSDTGCLMDGLPTSCSRVLRALNGGQTQGLTVSGRGLPQVDLLGWGIVLTEGPLQNDTRLWGVWVPGRQSGNEQNPRRKMSRDETSAILDDLLKTIYHHPGCEDALNQLLGELKSETGYGAGTITDIIEAFRKSGIAYTDDAIGETNHTGSGDAGTALDGVPGITLTRGGTVEDTSMTFMAEMIHWAAMPFEGVALHPDNHGYANKYTDPVLANAAYKLGWVMSAEQFRRTYPETIKRDMETNGRDMTDSKLGHFGMKNKCLGIKSGLSPDHVKP